MLSMLSSFHVETHSVVEEEGRIQASELTDWLAYVRKLLRRFFCTHLVALRYGIAVCNLYVRTTYSVESVQQSVFVVRCTPYFVPSWISVVRSM